MKRSKAMKSIALAWKRRVSKHLMANLSLFYDDVHRYRKQTSPPNWSPRLSVSLHLTNKNTVASRIRERNFAFIVPGAAEFPQFEE